MRRKRGELDRTAEAEAAQGPSSQRSARQGRLPSRLGPRHRQENEQMNRIELRLETDEAGRYVGYITSQLVGQSSERAWLHPNDKCAFQ